MPFLRTAQAFTEDAAKDSQATVYQKHRSLLNS